MTSHSWDKIIDFNIINSIMNDINKSKILFTPSKDKLLKPVSLCKYSSLKVVMIGGDPYNKLNEATGILFGNSMNTKTISKQLQLIKNAVINPEYQYYNIDFDITLESWCTQGILMINSAFTTEVNNLNLYALIWRPFVISLLKNLGDYNPGLIYVLFGRVAKTLRPYIHINNYVFEYNYPNYYIQNSIKPNYDIFDKINIILKQNNNDKIDWYKTLN